MDKNEAEKIVNDVLIKIQIAFKINRKEAVKILTDYIKNKEPKK